MPLMVTGGFRTRAGIEEALDSGAVDVVGLGRPLCGEPDLPQRLLAREVSELPRYEQNMQLGPGVFGQTHKDFRQEESSVGKEWVRTGSSRWPPGPKKKNKP